MLVQESLGIPESPRYDLRPRKVTPKGILNSELMVVSSKTNSGSFSYLPGKPDKRGKKKGKRGKERGREGKERREDRAGRKERSQERFKKSKGTQW